MPKLSGPMIAPKSGGAPKQAVVLLHGYGSDGNDLIGLAPYLRDGLPDAMFVAPNAPQQSAMMASGYQWFDISLDRDRLAARQVGLVAARPVLVEFLDDLWAQTGLTARDTLLIGFSQGAMMALHVGLSLPEALMGIVAFSGSFSPPAGFGQDGLAKPPVRLVHGDRDDVVAFQFSIDAQAALEQAGIPVRSKIIPGMGHGIGPEALAFATDFIAALAAPAGP